MRAPFLSFPIKCIILNSGNFSPARSFICSTQPFSTLFISKSLRELFLKLFLSAVEKGIKLVENEGCMWTETTSVALRFVLDWEKKKKKKTNGEITWLMKVLLELLRKQSLNHLLIIWLSSIWAHSEALTHEHAQNTLTHTRLHVQMYSTHSKYHAPHLPYSPTCSWLFKNTFFWIETICRSSNSRACITHPPRNRYHGHYGNMFPCTKQNKSAFAMLFPLLPDKKESA